MRVPGESVKRGDCSGVRCAHLSKKWLTRRFAMTRRFGATLLVAVSVTWGSVPLAAEIEERDLAGLRWRLLGPFRGGWATCAAGVPGEPAVFYFGSADGGVWRTTDAGVTWKPLFNEQGSASIGALALAP